jgi:hypothetical protein
MAALDSQPGGTPKLCSSVERTVERRSKITIVKKRGQVLLPRRQIAPAVPFCVREAGRIDGIDQFP